MLMEEIVIFLFNLRISLWPMLKKYPKTLYQSQIGKLRKCLRFTPISDSFNFTSCTVLVFFILFKNLINKLTIFDFACRFA